MHGITTIYAPNRVAQVFFFSGESRSDLSILSADVFRFQFRNFAQDVSTLNALIASLLAGSFIFIQCYVSGTRFAYALPAYAAVGVAGILALFATRDRSRLGWLAFGSALLCFGYLLWRAWTSPVEYLARTDLYSALACLVVYVLTSTTVTSRTLRGGIIGVVLALVVVEALFAGYQYAGGATWLPFNLQHPGAPFRARGTFISSIHFAGFLEAVAPFALAFAFWGSRTAWLRWMCAVIALLAYFAIALSGSRGAWISSVFSLLVFVILSLIAARKVQRERFPAALYLTILALVALPFVVYFWMQQSFGVRSRLELLGKVGEKSLEAYDVRVLNWQAALDQWRLDPVWGTGAGTHLYYGREFRRPGLQVDPLHAHSDYLELLAEYGIIGASLVALMLLCHFGSGLRGFSLVLRHRAENPYRSWPELAWTIGALAAAAAYLAHSAVDFNLHLPGNALWMAFVFGILANAGLPKNVERNSDDIPQHAPRFPTWFARLTTFSLGAAFLALILPKFVPEYWAEKSRVALRERRFDEAIAFADTAVTHDHANPVVLFQKGEAYRLKGNAAALEKEAAWKAAVEAYRASLQVFERDVFAWMRLARTLELLFDYAEARNAYRRAIELDPNNISAWGHYVAHLLRVGREAEAQEAIAKGQRLPWFDFTPYLDPPRGEKRR
jgi:O-antigen ligase